MCELTQILHDECEGKIKLVARHCGGIATSTVYDWFGSNEKKRAPMSAIFGITMAVGFGPIQHICRMCGGFFVPLKRQRKSAAGIAEVLRNAAKIIEDDAQARDPESSNGEHYSESELQQLERDVDAAINGLVSFVAEKRAEMKQPARTYFADSLATASRMDSAS